jgi:hypothetical protein
MLDVLKAAFVPGLLTKDKFALVKDNGEVGLWTRRPSTGPSLTLAIHAGDLLSGVPA